MLYDDIRIILCVLTGASKIRIFGHVALYPQRLEKTFFTNKFAKSVGLIRVNLFRAALLSAKKKEYQLVANNRWVTVCIHVRHVDLYCLFHHHRKIAQCQP